METMIDELKKTKTEYKGLFKNNDKFNELNEYLNDLKSKGLIKPESYKIPPVDTIGKRFYQTQINK